VKNLIREFNIKEVHICSIWKSGSIDKTDDLDIYYHSVKIIDFLTSVYFFLVLRRPLSNCVYQRRSLRKFVENQKVLYHLTRSFQGYSYSKEWAFDFCESQSENLRLRAYSYKGLVGLILKFESRRLNKLENILLRAASESIFITHNDIKYSVASHPVIVPNKIDLKCVFKPFENRNAAQIVFLGDMTYLPNKNALDFIYKLGLVGKYKIEVVGKYVLKDVSEYSSDFVHFNGYVSNLKEILPNSIFAIFISNDSTGLQNKLLDYINYGVPTIVNQEVAESFIGRPPFLIAKNQKEVEEVISKYLSDKENYESIVREGFKYIKENYAK